MLHRKDAKGLVVISQPAHAWFSGQLARNWGNGAFAEPMEEVSLAAEQHDIGFLAWEESPTLNAATGLPHTFMEMPTAMHLEIWSTGIQRMLLFGRYAALLVSLHFTALARRNAAEKQPEEKRLVDEFLAAQDGLQTSLRASLRHDSYFGQFATAEIIRRNQQRVSLWDWMSLLLCHGFDAQKVIEGVPVKDGIMALELVPQPGPASRVAIKPWPFRQPAVRLICEGRRLLQTYTDEGNMREALKAAEPVVLMIDLVPS
jgi:hypothetical protein